MGKSQSLRAKLCTFLFFASILLLAVSPSAADTEPALTRAMVKDYAGLHPRIEEGVPHDQLQELLEGTSLTEETVAVIREHIEGLRREAGRAAAPAHTISRESALVGFARTKQIQLASLKMVLIRVQAGMDEEEDLQETRQKIGRLEEDLERLEKDDLSPALEAELREYVETQDRVLEDEVTPEEPEEGFFASEVHTKNRALLREWLPRLGVTILPKAGPRVARLIRGLKSGEDRVVNEALEELAELEARAAAALPAILALVGAVEIPARVPASYAESTIAARAADTAASVGRIAVRPLIELLDSKKPAVRGLAVRALGQIEGEAQAAAPALRRLLKDADPYPRGAAALALSLIGVPDDETFRALTGVVFEDEDSMVRSQALVSLLRMENHRAAVADVLARIVRTPDHPLRQIALRSLATGDARTIPALRSVYESALADGNVAIRRALIGARSWVVDEDDAELLPLDPQERAFLEEVSRDDPDPDIRQAAEQAIAHRADPDTAGTEELERWLAELDAPNPLESMQALERIGAMGAKAKPAVPRLIELVREFVTSIESGKGMGKRMFLIDGVASALGRIGPDAAEAVPALVDLLTTMKNFGPEGLPAAFGLLGMHGASVVDALGRIGPDAEAALALLQSLEKDSTLDGVMGVSLDLAVARIQGRRPIPEPGTDD